MNNRFTGISLSLLCTLGVTDAAFADVTIEQKFNVDAAGALSMAAMQGTTVTSIAEDKSRTDSDLKFKSRLVQTFAGGAGKSSNIVRLDEDRVLDIDHKKKRYSEMSLADMRAQTERALQQMQDAQSSQQAGEPGSTSLPVEEQNCEWTDATVETHRSGQTQTFAGLSAEQTIITATQTCRDPETSKACDLTWTLEQWLSPDAPGGDEAQAFWKQYAEKLGLDELALQSSAASMAQLFSQYEQGWDEIEKHSSELQGFPLKAVMLLEVGGEECTTTDGQPISNENVYGNAAAEGVGSAAGGAIGGAITKGLFKSFGKKKQEQPAETVQAAAGKLQLFRVEAETTGIRTDAVGAERFEVPTGYTRME